MDNLNSLPLSQETIAQNTHNLKQFLEELIRAKGSILVDLSNLRFDGIEMPNLNLHGINLYGSGFVGSSMQCTNFTGANLEKASFRGVNLADACFRGAQLDNTTFVDCNLTGADLRGTFGFMPLRHVSFFGSDLRGASFSGSSLRRPNFAGCDLRGADLSRCNIMGGDFTAAYLSSANLMNAHISNSIFRNADLNRANTFGATFGGSDIKGANIAHSWMSIMCGNKSIKTDYNQRVLMMNFLLHWIGNGDDATEQEREVYKVASRYADDQAFNHCLGAMAKGHPQCPQPVGAGYAGVNREEAEQEA